MKLESIWIEGETRSGKSLALVQQFCHWVQLGLRPSNGENRTTKELGAKQATPPLLVFAATGDNRIELTDRLSAATDGEYPVQSTTPLAFFQNEVILYWPLLIQTLNLSAQFPLRVRPETEQELATRVWQPELDSGELRAVGVSEYRMVRRTLDLLQLAAFSGIPLEDTPVILKQGIPEEQGSPSLWHCMGELLQRWRRWCLERGLLTYGIITELYWRHLLPHPTYRSQLIDRYQGILADDVDEYPKIAADLFEILLDAGVAGVFTYNPQGAVRLGLGADPDAMKRLARRCRQEYLTSPKGFPSQLGEMMLELLEEPTVFLGELNEAEFGRCVGWIQTTSRGQLLRETAEAIAGAIHRGEVEPQDVVAIAPGLDAIARYTLRDILIAKGIPVQSLHEQRPLISVSSIRALLTLLALVYPGLGRLVDRESVAEMLVVLSGAGGDTDEAHPNYPFADLTQEEEGAEGNFLQYLHQPSASPVYGAQLPPIDPVRAGLLVDHCYSPAPENPRVLPVSAFPRWDRLGYRATAAYQGILQWIEQQRSQLEAGSIPSPLVVLDRAIQRFLWPGNALPTDQIAALRELIETAQHYWEVDLRLRDGGEHDAPEYVTVGQFIQLLRQGTLTANPFPVSHFAGDRGCVTLATIFQYRAARQFHRWQFWLDVGSPLWLSGGAASLFAAPLFLEGWSGDLWSVEAQMAADEDRLRRIVRDLLGRVSDRVILCHSDLATNGQEQTGPLLSVFNSFVALGSEVTR
ncbi:recombinase family protein [Phormidium sp. CCY1219]|uniref:recombinase family protein n=1 Tax=Phormidium sp. CCY1219 TaxID=2886104 RepID=UPI002D1E7568|nr:recombinase family protein [Phormidium sp. CCY1219]MEB3826968.1 recombinase family protein [Phormidium sp. CCY1219]